ncbi:9170_t:CDS:2, partial [Racocetra fulgida]
AQEGLTVGCVVEIALWEENFQDDVWNERGSKMVLKCLSDNYARSGPVASTSSAMRHIPPNSTGNVSTSKYCVATSNECSSLDPVNVSEPTANITEATLRKTVTEEVLDICELMTTIRTASSQEIALTNEDFDPTWIKSVENELCTEIKIQNLKQEVELLMKERAKLSSYVNTIESQLQSLNDTMKQIHQVLGEKN